ncbi:hypothetical protein ACFL6U_10675 [Planctomycetota bacterium]
MIRERYIQLLSGSIIVLCVLLQFVPSANAQFTGGGLKTYAISGNAGAPNVTLRGFPSPITSDSDGFYTVQVPHGWSGVVTPFKEGYASFEPPRRSFNGVKADQMGQDFLATVRKFKIGGSVGKAGVVFRGFPDGPVEVDENGRYEVIVPYGWTGTVTPRLEGFSFSPPDKTYQNINRDSGFENYTHSKLMYEISGIVSVLEGPVAGVVMKGLPDNPVTGPNGRYSVKVDYDWAGTVTPTRDGYVFDPAIKPYTRIDMSMTDEDYNGSMIQFTVSGNVGIGGVKISGLKGNVISTEDGYYQATVKYNFTGKITPVKEGFAFVPPDRSFHQVKADLVGQDFEAKEIKVRIAGSVDRAGAGVLMQGLVTEDGQPVVSNAQGRYEAVVSYNWYGEVTPMKDGFTFAPSSKPYVDITRDRLAENYRASDVKHVISGRILDQDGIGQLGVELKGFPTRVTTNPVGEYSTQVPYGWTGSVTPDKDGWEFLPPSTEYNNGVRENREAQDYSTTKRRITISGRIESTQGPVGGVTVMTGLGSDISAITDGDGRYSLNVPYGWNGQVSFLEQGHVFEPSFKPIKYLTQDMTFNVKAEIKTFKILGEIIIDGVPVPGVKIDATDGGTGDVTDQSGEFTVKVPYNWSGEIIPSKEGWEFNPPSKPYSYVTEDINDRMNAPAVDPAEAAMPTVPKDPFSETDMQEPEVLDPLGQDPTAVPEGELDTIEGVAPEFDIAEFDTTDPQTAVLLRQMQAMQDQIEALTQNEGAALSGASLSPLPGGLMDVEPTTAATTPSGTGAVINLSFIETDLALALGEIAAEADVTIITDPEILGLVTANISNVPLETALDIVLAGSGFAWKKTDHYYLVSSVKTDSPSFKDGSETRYVRMTYESATKAINMLSTAFRPYVQADPEGRMVTITAPPSIADRIAEDLRAMNSRPRQVLLDARIVSMENGDLLNIGVEWGWGRASVGVFGNSMQGAGDPLLDFAGKFPWGVQIGYTPEATFTDALTMQLNLMVENEEATIVSNPQVMAQDNRVAEIRLVREEYYMIVAPETVGSAYSRAELQTIESGTILSIIPHIGDNNDIVLEIAAELSDSVAKGRNTELPIVTRRSTKNEVIIQDGGTVAIAGLQHSSSNKNNKRVPGISKIPILGKLFQNDENLGYEQEVAFFITAKLVPGANTYNQAMQQQAAPAAPTAMQPSLMGSPAPASMMQPQPVSNGFQQDLWRQLQQPQQ